MRKYLCIVIFTIVFVSILVGGIWAQEEDEGSIIPTYGLGNQIFALNAGTQFPLFFQDLSSWAAASTNLSVGGTGSLEWSAYLTNKMTLGGEVCGSFSFSPNGRALIMVPLLLNYKYYFRFFPFEIPLTFSTGAVFVNLDNRLNIDPIIRPGVSLVWNMNLEWSFGLNLHYWWIPQIYFEEDLRENSRFGNFLTTTLSAVYHF